MDVAEENRLPLVLLVESGGADLPRQADVFVPGGEQFRRLTQLSAQGIPTVCVVFGSSTAGGAYLPGHERLHGHGRGPGPRLPGRAAAGEDGDRRGRGRGGARRGPHARPDLGPVRLPGPRRGRCPADRPGDRVAPALAAPGSRSARTGRRAAVPGRGAARHRIGRRARPLRRARGPGPRRRRLPIRGVQGVLRPAAGLRLGRHRRLSHRRRGEQRDPLLARSAEGGAVHRAVQSHRHPDPLRAEHHRASWWERATSRAASSRTGPS